jgi:hypothetical protein
MPIPPRKLAEAIPSGYYEAPRLLEVRLVLPHHPQVGPVRILLILEGGYELEVDATPAARGEFFQTLNLLKQDDC